MAKASGTYNDFSHTPEHVSNTSYRSTRFYTDEHGTEHQVLASFGEEKGMKEFFDGLKETYAKPPEQLEVPENPLRPLKVSFRETQQGWEKELLGVQNSKDFDPSVEISGSRSVLKSSLKRAKETDDERFERQLRYKTSHGKHMRNLCHFKF